MADTQEPTPTDSKADGNQQPELLDRDATEQAARDAEGQAGATEETQELESLRKFKQQALAEKTNHERERERRIAAEHRLAELERSHRPPTTDPQAAELENAHRMAAEAIPELRRLAAEGDPIARATLGTVISQEIRLRQQLEVMEFRSVPEEDREAVATLYRSGMFGSIEGARRHQQLEKRHQSLAAEIANLKEEQGKLEAQKKTEAAIEKSPESLRSVPAGGVRRFNVSTYEKKLDELPFEEKRKLMREVAEGKIRLVPD